MLEHCQRIFPSQHYITDFPLWKYGIDLIKNLRLSYSATEEVQLLQHKCSEALMTDGGRNESQI